MTNYCEYCGKGPFPNEGALNKHIGHSKDCQEKNQLAFKSYTSTIWNNTPNARIPSSLSPPPDETPGAQGDNELDILENDLLTVEHTNQVPLEPPRNRVTIEDVTEKETQDSGHYVEEYPTERKAGAAWGKEEPLFVRIQRDQQEDGTSKWGPFKDQEEWELAEWLSKNVGQKQTDTYLKLNIVSTYSLVQMQRAIKLTEQ